jgi:hypothetical protein
MICIVFQVFQLERVYDTSISSSVSTDRIAKDEHEQIFHQHLVKLQNLNQI